MEINYLPPPIPHKKTNNRIGIEKNLLNEFAMASEGSSGAQELLVTDMQGRLVISFRVSGSQGQQVWDTRQVEKGVYVYTLKAGTVSKQGKLVIQ
jgi:hypothetical protein